MPETSTTQAMGQDNRPRGAVTRKPAPCAALALLVLAAALNACGGGGGGGGGGTPGGGSGVQASAYFPTDVNNRWLYTDVSSTNAIGPTLISSIGTQSTGSQTGAVIQVSPPNGTGGTTSIYVNQADGIWQYPSALSDPLSARIGPIKVIPNPAASGASFTQVNATVDSGVDYDGDGKTDPITIHAVVSVVSTQDAQNVPAGNFSACMHLTTVVSETVNLTAGGTLTGGATEDDWYAPGVGLVRTAVTPSGAGSAPPSAQWLAEYRLAGAHSAAPAVTAQTPASATSRGATLAVSATFDRLMGTSSVTQAGTFTVADSTGAAVAGTVSMNGNTLNFAPSQAWASGAYTATLNAAATDAVGNPLAASHSWPFTVDATSPTIAVSTPASGAADVPLNSVISLQMSEAIDPASVTPNTIYLADYTGTAVPGTTTLLSDGLTLVFTPSAPLSRRNNYQATISSSATDLVGNPAQGGIVFRTTQGRFAAPVALGSPPNAISTIVTDLNRDGYNDVVLGLSTSGTPLAVMYGQPGGTLSAPVSITGGPASTFGGVAVGDVNGDGIPDVVVGADNQGMQVFLQDAQGNLTPGDFLNNVQARAMRIADIDGDGKNELVTISFQSTKVNIWHQDVNGHLVLQQSLDFGYYAGYGLEIGDVNGDGLPDIVVSMGPGVTGKQVAVFLSQGSGNFAAPVFLAADPTYGATGIAIGDVNGDGRNDIVVGTGGNSPTQIGVYYQNANGTLGAYTPVSTYDTPDAVRVADINGDGRADIVVVHDLFNSFGVYLQQADGSLAPEVLYDTGTSLGGTDIMQVGDINHDNRPDILFGGAFVSLQNAVPANQVAASAPRRPALAAPLAPIPRPAP